MWDMRYRMGDMVDMGCGVGDMSYWDTGHGMWGVGHEA